MTVLIVTHYSSPGPLASQRTGRGCVNPIFCVVILVKNYPGIALESPNRMEDYPLDYPSNALRSVLINKSQFLDPRWFLIFCLVLRADNVPSIKKYYLRKRKLFVTVSNPESTAKTADVRVEGQMAKWNQNLDVLYVFPLSLQCYG
jgi:hypothetical protein